MLAHAAVAPQEILLVQQRVTVTIFCLLCIIG